MSQSKRNHFRTFHSFSLYKKKSKCVYVILKTSAFITGIKKHNKQVIPCWIGNLNLHALYHHSWNQTEYFLHVCHPVQQYTQPYSSLLLCEHMPNEQDTYNVETYYVKITKHKLKSHQNIMHICYSLMRVNDD